MPLPSKNQNEKYSYKDYLTWPEGERWEIMDGIPYMQAAPSWQHQSISRELILQFGNYLCDKTCRVFAAPFDLRLPYADEKDEDISTVMQPDIVIICDRSKLQGTGYIGAPALVVEIVSPSSGKMDRLLKFNKYESTCVKEYWIIQPEEKTVMVFILGNNNRYGRPEVYTEDDKVKVIVFEDLIIDLKTIFS